MPVAFENMCNYILTSVTVSQKFNPCCFIILLQNANGYTLYKISCVFWVQGLKAQAAYVLLA